LRDAIRNFLDCFFASSLCVRVQLLG